MTPRQEAFINYLEEEYDINDDLELHEERSELNIEIESYNAHIDLELVVTGTTFTEEGGEPDEYLSGLRNKYIEIKNMTYYEDEEEADYPETFKDRMQSLFNEQLYDD